MKNANLYIHPKASHKPITQRNYTPKATMPKAKRSDVPLMYRRNGKHDVMRVAFIIICTLAILNCIIFLCTL